MSEPFVLLPGEGRRLWHYGDLMTIKADAAATGGLVTVMEQATAREVDTPLLHRHEHEDQAWYVLDGEVRFFVGETIHDTVAGTFAYGPRGVPHAHQVLSDRATLLVLTMPGGLEQFWYDSGEEAASPDIPPDGSGPIDATTRRAMLQARGVELIDR